MDGEKYATQTWWESRPSAGAPPRPWPAPFDRPFYLILNLAVGGKFLGNPDATTPFPAEMVVDYVRVYEKPGGYGPVHPRGPAPREARP
jgi:beta-glucanase (GH16 family)